MKKLIATMLTLALGAFLGVGSVGCKKDETKKSETTKETTTKETKKEKTEADTTKKP